MEDEFYWGLYYSPAVFNRKIFDWFLFRKIRPSIHLWSGGKFGPHFTVGLLHLPYIILNWAIHRNIKIEPASNATLSYQREMEELREYKRKVEADKKKAETLKNN